MPPKSERIELRLDEGFLSRIDDWRNSQTIQVSRSEAIRLLADAGLQTKDTTRVKFSNGEKFITALLAEWIQSHYQDQKHSQNPIISSVVNGNYWALEEKFKGIFDHTYCEPEVAFEAKQLLKMCKIIETNISNLREEECNSLKYKFLNGSEYVFVGFSLQQEEMYKNAVQQILLTSYEFEDFKRRSLNHSPSGRLETYRRMQRALNALRDNLSFSTNLSFSDLELILDAGFGAH